MRCVVCPLLKVVQVHQMDMRLDFGVCVRRLGHLPVTEDRGVRFSYTPPKDSNSYITWANRKRWFDSISLLQMMKA